MGGLLERAIPELPAGQGVVFLMRFYSLVIGTWIMSSRPPAVRAALEDPGLGLFDFEFAGVFRGAVTDSGVDEAGCGWVAIDISVSVDGDPKTTCKAKVALPIDADDNPWSRTGDRWTP